jgi:hypothetical protein
LLALNHPIERSEFVCQRFAAPAEGVDAGRIALAGAHRFGLLQQKPETMCTIVHLSFAVCDADDES